MKMSKNLVSLAPNATIFRVVRCVGIVLACSVLVAPGLASELVVNGGFETGNFNGWTTLPAPSGSVFGVGTSNVHTGRYSAYFGAVGSSDDTILQSTLPTVPGQSYIIDFWLAHPYSTSSNDFKAYWDGSPTPFLSLLNASFFNYSPSGHYTYTLPATGSSTTLRFSGREVPAWFYLDDVSVQPVPEPSTLLMLCMSAIGLLFFAWKRRG